MANIQEIVTPAANTITTLYTGTGSEIISTISISNYDTISTTYSLYFVPSGQTYGDTYAFPKGATILPGELITLTLGLTPKSGTVIRCISVNGKVNFMLNGQ